MTMLPAPTPKLTYALVTGPTRDAILRIKAEGDAADDGLKALAAGFGAEVRIAPPYQPVFIFKSISNLPPGWWGEYTDYDPAGYGGCKPRFETARDEEGEKIQAEIDRLHEKSTMQAIFNRYARAQGAAYEEYGFEVLGNNVVISCPTKHFFDIKKPLYQGDSYLSLPPDARVLPYHEYIRLKEEATPASAPAPKILHWGIKA